MDETEEIDEFVVSNNLLATSERPQLQHNHWLLTMELLSGYASNNVIHVYARFVKSLIAVITCY